MCLFLMHSVTIFIVLSYGLNRWCITLVSITLFRWVWYSIQKRLIEAAPCSFNVYIIEAAVNPPKTQIINQQFSDTYHVECQLLLFKNKIVEPLLQRAMKSIVNIPSAKKTDCFFLVNNWPESVWNFLFTLKCRKLWKIRGKSNVRWIRLRKSRLSLFHENVVYRLYIQRKSIAINTSVTARRQDKQTSFIPVNI